MDQGSSSCSADYGQFILPPTTVNESQSIEGVVAEEPQTPVSPSKRLCMRLEKEDVMPESPDMKFARHRLGDLLSSIRKGDAPSNMAEQKGSQQDDYDRRGRGPGRPRKLPAVGSKTKNGEMIFELRGKPFALREDRVCTEYQLCRAWMRGKLSDDDRPPAPPPADPSLSIELLATRNVTSLPRATSPYTVAEAWPPRNDRDIFDKAVDPEDVKQLRAEYSRHWKKVKNQWKSHKLLREQRYHRTTDLITTIYKVAQNST